MSLSRNEARVFKLHKFVFGYIWKFPLQWDDQKTTKLIFCISPSHCKAYPTALALILLIGCLNVSCPIFLKYNISNERLAATATVLAITSAIQLCGTFVISVLFISDSFTHFLNFIFEMVDEIHKRKFRLNNLTLMLVNKFNLFIRGNVFSDFQKPSKKIHGLLSHIFSLRHFCLLQ